MEAYLKVCKSCKETKALTDFHKHGTTKDGLNIYCRQCTSAKARVWILNNREKSILNQRKSALKTQYGMTLEDYDNLYKSQEGKCAICRTPKAVLDIDHCHITNKVRGLLCGNCNRGIGMFNHDPARIRRAIEFLRKEQECNHA